MGNETSRAQPLPIHSARHTRERSLQPRYKHKLSCVTAMPSQESLHSYSPTSDAFPSKHALSEKHAPVIQHSLQAVKPEEQVLDAAPDLRKSFDDFVNRFPEYRKTWILDSLRRSDYTRLAQSGETYVDYMGGCLYPESLVQVHSDMLSRNIMGNTHSVSNSSQVSTIMAAEARAAVLSYFNAPKGYTVIFTPNATGALKLVGESFPFGKGGAYVLAVDSHNSVNGIRRFASQAGAKIVYLRCTNRGGVDVAETENVLAEHQPANSNGAPCLLALTGMSNISNSKNPLSLCAYAKQLGYYTLLDAAALATTSVINLSETPVDAMAVSFYKMFGFPTGVGGLIVKEELLHALHRPWFAGGTVSLVQAPGMLHTMAMNPMERFEDGTINYLSLPAITNGLNFLSTYLPFLPLRLSCLLHYLVEGLDGLRHDVNGARVVKIVSRLPTRRLKDVGEQSNFGSTISMLVYDARGKMLHLSFIEHAAAKAKISIRTGCVCNPGAATTMIGLEDTLEGAVEGDTLRTLEQSSGHELGVVRISLGLGSNFVDVWNVLQFMRSLSVESEREALLREWKNTSKPGGH